MKKACIIIPALLILAGCTQTQPTQQPAEPEQNIPTNCTSRFDGCNNCSVESGEAKACTLMHCEHPQEAKCTEFKK